MCRYRECYEENLEISPEQKEKCFHLIMEHLTTGCAEPKMCHIVAVEFLAQCNIPIGNNKAGPVEMTDSDGEDDDDFDLEEFSQQDGKSSKIRFD